MMTIQHRRIGVHLSLLKYFLIKRFQSFAYMSTSLKCPILPCPFFLLFKQMKQLKNNFPANQRSSNILINRKQTDTFHGSMRKSKHNCWKVGQIYQQHSPMLLHSFIQIPTRRQNPYKCSATLFNAPTPKPLGMLTVRQLDEWMHITKSTHEEDLNQF